MVKPQNHTISPLTTSLFQLNPGFKDREANLPADPGDGQDTSQHTRQLEWEVLTDGRELCLTP